MLQENNIAIKLESQGFQCETYMRDQEEKKSVFIFESQQGIDTVRCPKCQGHVNICGLANKHLKDIPIWVGITQELCFHCHRFRCVECGAKFTEEIPLRYPGTRITERAATWVQTLLRNKLSIRAVQNITGIHWETVRFLHKELMMSALKQHAEKHQEDKYQPKYLAVDEFAIHKGHTYATCVMDLETGEVLWVGQGRTKAAFSKFFDEIDRTLLSEVRAVAMDMNASYHILVQQHLPQAQIVYDRYHMQAQYGKDVLGVVRLDDGGSRCRYRLLGSLDLLRALHCSDLEAACLCRVHSSIEAHPFHASVGIVGHGPGLDRNGVAGGISEAERAVVVHRALRERYTPALSGAEDGGLVNPLQVNLFCIKELSSQQKSRKSKNSSDSHGAITLVIIFVKHGI